MIFDDKSSSSNFSPLRIKKSSNLTQYTTNDIKIQLDSVTFERDQLKKELKQIHDLIRTLEQEIDQHRQ